MRFEGDPEVLRNVLRRQKLVARGDLRQYQYRPILFASTGVRRGVVGAGKGRAIERRKLNKVFTHMLGSSTGAASGQFMPGDQIGECIDLYWKEAVDEKFFSLKRLLGNRPVQDTRFLCEAFRGRINLEAFHASPVEFHVGVTCALTGEGRFLDAKRSDMHPVDLVRASMSIPGLCGGPVYIDGHPYYDGAGAMGMPTQKIVEQFSPTDLLIFPNCPDERKGSRLGGLVSRAMLARQPEAVQRAFLTRYQRFADGVKYLRQQTACRWAIVWTDESIGQYERNPLKLQDAANRAEAFMERLLLDAETHVQREEHQAIAAQ
jgi:predicted patatin/cPLA2 family phospholipase